MFTFCNVELGFRNGGAMDNGWWLLVQNEWELMDWFAQANNFAKVWMDLKTNNDSRAHFNTMQAYVMDFKIQNNKEGKKSYSNLDLAQMYNEMTLDNKAKYLKEKGPIFINRAGGFCSVDAFRIKAEMKKDSLIFPDTKEKEIKISQFPGGTHFYASINAVSISFNGQGKWDSYPEAKAAVDAYLKLDKEKTLEEDFND